MPERKTVMVRIDPEVYFAAQELVLKRKRQNPTFSLAQYTEEALREKNEREKQDAN